MYNFISPKRVPMLAPRAEISFGTPNVQPDDALTVFRLLSQAEDESVKAALITVVDVVGGSARGRGAHMAVLEDGRYCGYVSGGCVEGAIAAEAIEAIKKSRDEVLRIGTGSRLMDVTLPCGGGIDLHIHVAPDPLIVRAAIEAMEFREPFAISFDPAGMPMSFGQPLDDDAVTGWREERFERTYRPRTRLVLIGRGLELETTAKIAVAAGFDIQAYCSDGETADAVHRIGAKAEWLATPAERPSLEVDPYSAVVFLFHDHDWEIGLIELVLKNYSPFFIGALGSRRTHARRREVLAKAGISEALIKSIHGPVGLFGPTRDAASLALSILAHVTQAREQAQVMVQ